MKFLHTMIRVKDIEKSLDFYGKLLGMKLVRTKRLEDCTLYFLEDECGSQIELTYNDVTPSGGYQNGSAFGHLAFEIKSFNEFSNKMNEAGCNYLHEPFDLDGKGSIIAFIKDPDGNEIELVKNVVWN